MWHNPLSICLRRYLTEAKVTVPVQEKICNNTIPLPLERHCMAHFSKFLVSRESSIREPWFRIRLMIAQSGGELVETQADKEVFPAGSLYPVASRGFFLYGDT